MRTSDAILACFSQFSVAKEGYVQREYKNALEYQEEKPEGGGIGDTSQDEHKS